MKNVLLVATSFEEAHRASQINKNSHYPLGLGYIHSVVEELGHNVKTLFLNDYDYESCIETVIAEVQSFNPDLIGFNVLTANRVSTFNLIEAIQSEHPQIIMLLGGIHASLMYEQILKRYPFITAIILGEGELTIQELIQRIDSCEDISLVKGIAYYEDGRVIKTESRELIEDLDILPFPKHEVFFNSERTLANILTSRGCVFKCSFCVLDIISRGRIRYRSVNNVIEEIEDLLEKFPQIETIWISDDNFTMNNKRTIDFCEKIIERKIKVKFVCSGRFKPFTPELVQALEKSGFEHILFGLESGSEKVLERSNKKITKKDIIDTITLFKNSRIDITAFLIVGLEGENEVTVKETIDFVKELQRIKYIFYRDIAILMVYPHTRIYEITKKNGVINDEYWLTDNPTPFYTVENDESILRNYKNKILNHIAFERVFTQRGFLPQLSMIPSALRYFIKNNNNARKKIIHSLKRAITFQT